MGIVRPVMAEFPYAWSFYLPFVLILTLLLSASHTKLRGHCRADSACRARPVSGNAA